MIKKKIVLAVTGASGAVYAELLIKKLVTLKEQLSEACLVFSDTAKVVWEYELPGEIIKDLPFKIYENKDFFAPCASGSSAFDVMIIAPCSMGTLGRIASGMADTLITRCADVILKERKKLILVTREMPLNLIHIRNMETVTLAGGIICPASPSFYSLPKKKDELLNTVIEKVIELAGFEAKSFKWGNKKSD
jgi:flavin prenyltransferase